MKHHFKQDIERAEHLLSSAATFIAQATPYAKRSDRKELRKIELDCVGHSAALARIGILFKPRKPVATLVMVIGNAVERNDEGESRKDIADWIEKRPV